MMTKKTFAIATAFSLAIPTLAMAHPGHGSGLSEGLLHPLTGVDHLLAIAAIGLLSVRVGGRALWALPAAFVACGLVGGALAWSSTLSAGLAMPWVELMIVASVMVCGILLVRRESTSTIALSMVPLFGLFHGYAHVQELGASMAMGSYSLGLLFATATLLGSAIGVGLLVQSCRSQSALVGFTRTVGASLIVAAAAMWIA